MGKIVKFEGGAVAAPGGSVALINDLTTGGTDKAATAETVKTLNTSKAPVGHTHTSSQITDLVEAVQDIVGLFFGASNANVTYNDAANTITISATGGTTDLEAVHDALGIALVPTGGMSIVLNDAADTITLSYTVPDSSITAAKLHPDLNGLIGWDYTSTKIQDVFKWHNVTKYGAKGDGTTDDTAAFQNAINGAIADRGKIISPAPPNYYKITSTLTFGPPNGTNETQVDWEGFGNPRRHIKYTGGVGTACIQAPGLRFSTWKGVNVHLDNTTTDQIAFDIDTLGSASSNSFNTFIGCNATLGKATGQKGWRVGHLSLNGGDISCLNWISCLVYGDPVSTSPPNPRAGQIGWHIEGSNTLQNVWNQCFAAYLDTAVSNVSGTGANGAGNGAMYFFGFGTSQNNVDMLIGNSQSYVFSGGRFESGRRVLQVNNSNVSPSIIFQGVEINDYDPVTVTAERPTNYGGALFYLDMPCSLEMQGCNIKAGTHAAYGANMIRCFGGGSGTRYGRVIVDGGAIEATNPFYSNGGNGTNWNFYVRGVAQQNNAGVAVGMMTDTGGASFAPLNSPEFTGNVAIGAAKEAASRLRIYATSGATPVRGIRLDADSGATVFSMGGNGLISVDGPGKVGGRWYMKEDGKTGYGVGTGPTARLDIEESTGYNQFRMRTTYTPTGSADANGNTGDFAWDANFVYMKTASGWRRSALAAF